MQAVILAAGKSSRFEPFSFLGHKSLFPFFGKPLLQHTLEKLKKAEINDVIIVVGENSPIEKLVIPPSGMHVQFVVQKEKLGMGNALLTVEKYLEESFFLLSGYHVDVADFAKEMLSMYKKTKKTVLLAKIDTLLEKYGVIEVSGDHVTSLKEKEHTVDSEKKLRLVSIYLLTKPLLQILRALPTNEYHFEKALDTYAQLGNVVYILAKKPTITLKNTWDLFSVKDYLLATMKRKIASTATIAKSAIIEGDVVVSEGVKILEGACIKGPCFLGKNVIVGNNAILRGGVIAEKDVVIGATMEAKNCVLLEGVTTHTGFIGDSIVGPYSRLAAGFCSANVRFDRKEITCVVRNETVNTHLTHFGVVIGQHADTGTNVSVMPGIHIGNYVTIGPSTTVMEHVEDSILLYTEFKTVKKRKHM